MNIQEKYVYHTSEAGQDKPARDHHSIFNNYVPVSSFSRDACPLSATRSIALTHIDQNMKRQLLTLKAHIYRRMKIKQDWQSPALDNIDVETVLQLVSK